MKGIPSYGLLCKNQNNQIVFVQRRHTVEYIEVICGNYTCNLMLKVFLYKLTMQEKNSLMSKSFLELWNYLWRFHSRKKFTTNQLLKFEANKLKIKRMIREINKTNFLKVSADITLPKGRKIGKETALDASIREFVEETGIQTNYFTVFKHHYIVEHFMGTNEKKYSTQYFFATMNRYFNRQQLVCDKKEVSNVFFLSRQEAMDRIDIRKPELRSVIMKIK